MPNAATFKGGVWGHGERGGLTGHPGPKTACAACGEGTGDGYLMSEAVHPFPALAPNSSTYLYRGCSDVSEGDRSGMEREVDDRVVAMEAVVASSKDGGVQGRRSGRPVGAASRHVVCVNLCMHVFMCLCVPSHSALPQALAFSTCPPRCPISSPAHPHLLLTFPQSGTQTT